jgi:cobalamin synthase
MMLFARRVTAATAGLLVLAAAMAERALAGTTDFGRNLGDEVKGLAVALFLAVAGLVTLPILGRRDVNGGIVLALLVIVLGGFIFAQGSVKQVIVDLWSSLTA